LFKTQAGLFIVHIPYAGGNPAQLALLSGQVDLNFDNLASAAANIRAGKLRALAVTTQRRASALPDLPTMAEAGAQLGLANFDISTWFGLFGPAGLPAAVLARLNQGFVAALQAPDTRERLGRLMAEPAPSTPGQFADFVKAELAKYGPLVKASGAKID
jgi:tripartite-type tricarboxylate transporter receptor subunit TctC